MFEPAFVPEGLLVRIDIFVKNESSIELIEVKAKAYDDETWLFWNPNTYKV